MRAALHALAGLFALAAASGCDPPGGPDAWATARRDRLVLSVEITGSLKAVDSAMIGPPTIPDVWDFKIALMAPEGSQVEPGQPVLGFDPTVLTRALEEKQNEAASADKELETKHSSAQMSREDEKLKIAEAEANLRKAGLQASRGREITSFIELKKAAIDRDLAEREVEFARETAEHARASDRAEVESLTYLRDRARRRVQELSTSIRGMTVAAPRAGTVIYVANWRGEKKKVGDSTWRAEKVLEIVSLEQMRARGDVDETDASKLATGQPVTLRLDARPDHAITGRIARIADAVRRQSPQTPLKVVSADIELDHTDPQTMRPGMRFRGQVETGSVADALIIPLDAIAITRDGPMVRRRSADGVERVHVRLGARNAQYVEVLEGLREGDQVARATDSATSGASAQSTPTEVEAAP